MKGNLKWDVIINAPKEIKTNSDNKYSIGYEFKPTSNKSRNVNGIVYASDVNILHVIASSPFQVVHSMVSGDLLKKLDILQRGDNMDSGGGDVFKVKGTQYSKGGKYYGGRDKLYFGVFLWNNRGYKIEEAKINMNRSWKPSKEDSGSDESTGRNSIGNTGGNSGGNQGLNLPEPKVDNRNNKPSKKDKGSTKLSDLSLKDPKVIAGLVGGTVALIGLTSRG